MRPITVAATRIPSATSISWAVSERLTGRSLPSRADD
jgi:hypothetical protein